MPTTLLTYTGPVSELGLTGPETGIIYVFRPGDGTPVEAVDVPGLLRRFPGLLEEVRPKRQHDGRRSPTASDSESAAPERPADP